MPSLQHQLAMRREPHDIAKFKLLMARVRVDKTESLHTVYLRQLLDRLRV